MALVPYLTSEQVAPEYSYLLERPINLFRALLNSPDALVNFHKLAEWIRWDCTLDPRLRELMILQVGYLAANEYEWSHHVILARQFGVTDQDIQGLIDMAEGRESTLDELDRLVIAATSEITTHRRVSDGTWAQLAARFDARQLTELVVVVSFYNMAVRVLGALRIDVEPEWKAPLDQFPLPPPR